MPRKTPEIAVSPAVLRWARETAGYPKEAVARRLGVPGDRVRAWEQASDRAYLTVRQLEALAQFCKRPLATLLLLKPPDEPPSPQDFRRDPKRHGRFVPNLKLAMRRASRLQRLARDMMEAIGLPSSSEIPEVNRHQDPESVARAQRAAFNITVQEQLEWKDPWEAFRRWRDALEARRVLVFQANFPRDEAQGFSVSDAHPYAIVVTSKDPPTARCFTLFHELAHLLLRQGGICLTEEVPTSDLANIAETETWCQRFAEAFLVDRDALTERYDTLAVINRAPNYEEALNHLAFSFKVSRAVILFRLLHTNLLSQERFWQEYVRLQEEAQAEATQTTKAKKERKWGPPRARQTVQERGRLFTSLVLEALDREILGYTEVIDYLGIRLKHLEKVRQAAHG